MNHAQWATVSIEWPFHQLSSFFHVETIHLFELECPTISSADRMSTWRPVYPIIKKDESYHLFPRFASLRNFSLQIYFWLFFHEWWKAIKNTEIYSLFHFCTESIILHWITVGFGLLNRITILLPLQKKRPYTCLWLVGKSLSLIAAVVIMYFHWQFANKERKDTQGKYI